MFFVPRGQNHVFLLREFQKKRENTTYLMIFGHYGTEKKAARVAAATATATATTTAAATTTTRTRTTRRRRRRRRRRNNKHQQRQQQQQQQQQKHRNLWSERCPLDLNHKETPKIYQIECQKELQKIYEIKCESQIACQKICQNGDHSKKATCSEGFQKLT